MLAETIRLLVVSLVLLVVPGYLLVEALWPRRGLTRIERAYLTLAGGVVVVTLVGLVLGFLPHDGEGSFRTWGTGVPAAELAILGVSALLFYVALHRGAFPRLAERYPQLLAR